MLQGVILTLFVLHLAVTSCVMVVHVVSEGCTLSRSLVVYRGAANTVQSCAQIATVYHGGLYGQKPSI